MFPAHAVLEDILQVKVNSKSAREQAARRERFVRVTPFLDKYEVDEWQPLPPYLCVVRYVTIHSLGEVLESLEEAPFQAATLGRLFDLCRAHPRRRFGYRIVFLGTSWWLGSNIGITAYPCLAEGKDGVRRLPSMLDRGRHFKATWRYALQPHSMEIVGLLKEILEERRAKVPARRTRALLTTKQYLLPKGEGGE